MGKRLPYSEGDWFAVPLRGGGYAVGIVARMAPGGTVLLGYFFGPRLPGVPALEDLENYRPDHAILVTKFGDSGLLGGEWPLIGRLDSWNRAAWPMPDFGRVESIEYDVFWRVRYPDDNPNGEPSETRITRSECNVLPEDGMFGWRALQVQLSHQLGEEEGAVPMPTSEVRPTSSPGAAAMAVTHYLYFPSREAADRAAERIRDGGSRVTVREWESDWLVLVDQMIPASEEALDQVEEELEILAVEEGGEYDGYEREVRQYPVGR